MANQIGDGVAPETNVNDVEGEGTQDVNALEGKVEELTEANKQLFARAKKAEGFELKDGDWVKSEEKAPKKEPKVEDKPSKEPSQADTLGRLALLRTEGVKTDKEIALFDEVMAETGKDEVGTLSSNYFQHRLSELREAEATADALPKGKQRPSGTGTTDIDIAVAKFRETGELPQDLKTRIAVKNKVVEQKKNEGMFEGPAVIGPTG